MKRLIFALASIALMATGALGGSIKMIDVQADNTLLPNSYEQSNVFDCSDCRSVWFYVIGSSNVPGAQGRITLYNGPSGQASLWQGHHMAKVDSLSITMPSLINTTRLVGTFVPFSLRPSSAVWMPSLGPYGRFKVYNLSATGTISNFRLIFCCARW